MTAINLRFVRTAIGVAGALALLMVFVSASGADAKAGAAGKIAAVDEQMRADLRNCNSQGLSLVFTTDARMIGPAANEPAAVQAGPNTRAKIVSTCLVW